MGYDVELVERTYNPTTAIWFDQDEGVMHGGASDYGDDYGIAW
jgi:gamma-glutamyltranspeptidase/glutathione hydrolase